jgi:hypothetical protein
MNDKDNIKSINICSLKIFIFFKKKKIKRIIPIKLTIRLCVKLCAKNKFVKNAIAVQTKHPIIPIIPKSRLLYSKLMKLE